MAKQASAPKARTPKPGAPVRGSTTGRPIMAALDLLGRRWTLRILWELREGPRTFRGLQEAAGGPSPSVLNARLKELRDARLIESTDDGYAVTPIAQELLAAIQPMKDWSERWAALV